MKRKIPLLLLFFLCTSLTNVIGLGLLGIFLQLSLVPSSELIQHGLVLNKISGLFQEKNGIYLIGVSLIVLFSLKAFWSIFSQKKIHLIASQYINRLKLKLIYYYQHSSYSFHLMQSSAEMTNKINLIDSFANQILINLLKICFSCFLIIGILAFLLLIYPLLTAILFFIIGSIFFLYFWFIKKKIIESGRRMNQASMKSHRTMFNALTGLSEIRVLGRESFFSNIFKQETLNYENSASSFHSLKLVPRNLIECFTAISLILLFLYTSSIHAEPTELLPALGIFVASCLRLFPAVNGLISQLDTFYHNTHNIELLYFEFKKLEHQSGFILKQHDDILPFTELALQDVSFKYDNVKNPILTHVTFTLKKGEAIGLMGMSGSGKTTFVNLILGLLHPDSGLIKVNGSASFDLRAWLNNFAYIPQMSFIMNDTLKHNIALGIADEDINEAKLNQAVQLAQLSDAILNMNHGIETVVGEYGVRLSGGQRQRVALARALYFDREIIIMDEATSALDNETEYQVIQSIKKLRGLKTLIIIAHRESTLEYCDFVYEIEQGNIRKRIVR